MAAPDPRLRIASVDAPFTVDEAIVVALAGEGIVLHRDPSSVSIEFPRSVPAATSSRRGT